MDWPARFDTYGTVKIQFYRFIDYDATLQISAIIDEACGGGLVAYSIDFHSATMVVRGKNHARIMQALEDNGSFPYGIISIS